MADLPAPPGPPRPPTKRPRKKGRKHTPPMPRAQEFVDFLVHEGCRESTARAYLRVANRIYASKLSPQDWIAKEARRPDPRTGDRGSAKKTVGVLRAAVSYYILWQDPGCGLTRAEIAAKLPSSRPFREGMMRESVEPEALETFKEKLLKMPEEQQVVLHLIVSLLDETGARIAEICGLQLEDIDRSGSRIILHGKGGRTRSVKVTSNLLRQIDDYLVYPRGLHNPPGEHLFWGKRWATPIWTTGVNRDMRNLMESDEGYFTPHQVRHLFATELVQSGAKLHSAREVLGHKNISTLDPYLHSSQRDQDKDLKRRRAYREKQRLEKDED